MKINPETAATLGDKLASLNLTEEEGVLLTTLLADDSEVSGFGRYGERQGVTLNYEEIKVTYLSKVISPLPKSWNIEQGSAAYTEVEWT